MIFLSIGGLFRDHMQGPHCGTTKQWYATLMGIQVLEKLKAILILHLHIHANNKQICVWPNRKLSEDIKLNPLFFFFPMNVWGKKKWLEQKHSFHAFGYVYCFCHELLFLPIRVTHNQMRWDQKIIRGVTFTATKGSKLW